jgi:putative ABC transport system substrate-binding protein
LGALGYPSDPVWRSTWPEAQDAARQLRLDIDPILVGALDQLPVAFAGLGKRVQALFVAPQSGFWIHRKNVVALVARERLPASYESKQFVDEGGLVSYGPDYFALNRSIGRYVDKILKGTKPADLPVEMPTEFELAVNVKTARTLGLTIPPTVLARAHALVQ